MANYISKIKIGDIAYSLKDTEVRAAVEALQIAATSSLIFKGVVSNATDITGLTNYKIGWTYKANATFSSSLGLIENGDMIICIADFDTAYQDSDWTVIQNNIDIMQGADASQNGVAGLVPAPASADSASFLRGDGTWSKIKIKINDLEQEEEDYVVFDGGNATSLIAPPSEEGGGGEEEETDYIILDSGSSTTVI